MSTKPTTKPVIDFHDKDAFIMPSKFLDANLPRLTATESLMNLPTKKAGIIWIGFIRAIPPAKNNGVVGSGNKE